MTVPDFGPTCNSSDLVMRDGEPWCNDCGWWGYPIEEDAEVVTCNPDGLWARDLDDWYRFWLDMLREYEDLCGQLTPSAASGEKRG